MTIRTTQQPRIIVKLDHVKIGGINPCYYRESYDGEKGLWSIFIETHREDPYLLDQIINRDAILVVEKTVRVNEVQQKQVKYFFTGVKLVEYLNKMNVDNQISFSFTSKVKSTISGLEG